MLAVKHIIAKKPEEAYQFRDNLIRLGAEGVVAKRPGNFWINGRSPSIVKLKDERVSSLRIINFKEGSGAFQGLVGSLLCISEDEKLAVYVSGFDMETRLEITRNRQIWLDKIIDVKHSGVIATKKPGDPYSLVDPRMLNNQFRTDLFEADSIDKIMGV